MCPTSTSSGCALPASSSPPTTRPRSSTLTKAFQFCFQNRFIFNWRVGGNFLINKLQKLEDGLLEQMLSSRDASASKNLYCKCSSHWGYIWPCKDPTHPHKSGTYVFENRKEGAKGCLKLFWIRLPSCRAISNQIFLARCQVCSSSCCWWTSWGGRRPSRGSTSAKLSRTSRCWSSHKKLRIIGDFCQHGGGAPISKPL